MYKSQKRLLIKIVGLLVDEWGAESVRWALHQFESGDEATRPNPVGSMQPRKPRPRSERSRPSPTDLVLRQKLPRSTKELLLTVAGQYEAKRFLPTTADVRNFLAVRGIPASNIKNRSEAFRRVLELLLETQPDRLEQIIREGMRAGPSQLGPISDAIRAANSAMRTSGSSDLFEEQDRAIEDESQPGDATDAPAKQKKNDD